MLRRAGRRPLQGGGQGLVRVPAQQVPHLPAPCHQARGLKGQAGHSLRLHPCAPALPLRHPGCLSVSPFMRLEGTAHTWTSRDPLLGSWGPWGVNPVP